MGILFSTTKILIIFGIWPDFKTCVICLQDKRDNNKITVQKLECYFTSQKKIIDVLMKCVTILLDTSGGFWLGLYHLWVWVFF